MFLFISEECIVKYILSEKEYQELQQSVSLKLSLEKKELQKLCTTIANTMPVTWTWGAGKETPTPWGCMLTADDWYCDECPVQKICPNERKEYSQ